MKKSLIPFLLIMAASTMSAQAWHGQGDQKFQAGINLWGKGNFGVKASYDYGIAESISLGAGAGIYFNGDTKRADRDKADFSIYGRANYHLQNVLNLPQNMDLYPGISMGILGDTFDFGAHIGFRYFFSDNIGAYAEVGNRGGIGVVFNL